MSSVDSTDSRHEMPEDPTQNPEEALDTLEERVFGETANQERDDDEGAPGSDDEDASASTPVADEPPA